MMDDWKQGRCNSDCHRSAKARCGNDKHPDGWEVATGKEDDEFLIKYESKCNQIIKYLVIEPGPIELLVLNYSFV